MLLDPKEVEELAKTLYIRALKLLPPDIKAGFAELQRRETDATGSTVLGTMVENIAVAERTNNLLCQDTGIPIYNVTIGRNVEFDGAAMKEAIRRGCERATQASIRCAPRWCIRSRARTSRPRAASACRSSMSISTRATRPSRSR